MGTCYVLGILQKLQKFNTCTVACSYIWDILFFITVQHSEGPDYSCEVVKCRNSTSVGEATCYTKLTFSLLVFLKVSYFHTSHSCEPAKKTGLAKWKHVSDKDTGIFITSKIQKATIICLQEKSYNKTQLTFTAFNRTKPFSSVYSPTCLCRYTKEIHKGSIYAVPAGKDHLGGKQDVKFLKRNFKISSMPKVTSPDNWPSFSIFLNSEFISTT